MPRPLPSSWPSSASSSKASRPSGWRWGGGQQGLRTNPASARPQFEGRAVCRAAGAEAAPPLRTVAAALVVIPRSAAEECVVVSR